MFLRSTGWLCTATIFQAFVAPAAHSQEPVVSPTPAISPTPSPSPTVQVPEAEQWKVEGTADQQAELNAGQQPAPQPSEAPAEQESGWTGGLLDQAPESEAGQEPVVENEQEPEHVEAPLDPRSQGYTLLFGPIAVRPQMLFQLTRDDNILISSSHPKRDVVYILSPGVVLGAGDFLLKEYNFFRLEYEPTLTLFNHFSNFNSLEQHLRLEGQYSFGRLKLGGNFEYDKLAGPDRDVGGRVNRDIYDTDLSANYLISDKTSIETDTGLWFRHYQNQIGSKEIVNHTWANYSIVPKLDVAAGVAVGILQPDHGSHQNFQQALVRLRYASSATLTFNGNVGVEFREIANAATRVTPVFGLSTEYALSAGTKLSINGSRNVTNSAALNGENYTATRIALDLNQHLIGNLFLTLGGGYENDSYSQATSSVSLGRQREDNYLFFHPSLDYRLKDWANISVSYSYQSNKSNFPTSSFRDRQISLEVRFGF